MEWCHIILGSIRDQAIEQPLVTSGFADDDDADEEWETRRNFF